MTTELAPVEAQALTEHEAVIERGLNTFTEVGNALLAIRDQRLYRQTHEAFEDYCRERWNLSRTRAYELMSASGIVSAIADTGLPVPVNEGQARELARVPESQRAEVWQQTLERTDGKPTAAAIRETYAPSPAAPQPGTDEQQAAAKAREDQREQLLSEAVAEFPELEHYAERPEKAIALAANLRAFPEPERPMRRETLAKAIAAEQRQAEPPREPDGPNYYELADAIFLALNTAAAAVARNGGTGTIRRALVGSPPLMVQTWREQFTELSDTCAALAKECTPQLRSVR